MATVYEMRKWNTKQKDGDVSYVEYRESSE